MKLNEILNVLGYFAAIIATFLVFVLLFAQTPAPAVAAPALAPTPPATTTPAPTPPAHTPAIVPAVAGEANYDTWQAAGTVQ